MMIRIAIALLALLVSTTANAESEQKLEPWQEAALKKVMEYQRVREAAWQTNTLLWLFAYDADVAWDNMADQVSCNHLREAGKPENRTVMIAFYEFGAGLRGEAKRLGYSMCK